jgi:lipoate-protein ligase A
MRFLIDPPMTGASNMARDLELLAEGVPTVRLYAWKPACVSLGYAQPETDIDPKACSEFGLDVVRRPTGGGAILHEEDEVTYAVVLPRSVGPQDLFGSYRFIANGVIETLSEFGLRSGFVEGHTGRDPLCYLREEGVSVSFEGRKISGGAQKRTKTAILQHGTILLSRRTDVLSRVFRVDPEKVDANIACLRDVRPQLTRDEVLRAAVSGFRRAMEPLAAVPGA